MPPLHLLRCFPAFLALLASTAIATAQSPSVAEYDSIQAAVDANPGKMVFVPAGDHTIARHIQLGTNGSGLYGPGRIIQTNPEQPIVRIENARGVQLRDLTLTRPEGQMDTTQEGVSVRQCAETTLENVRVIDNRTIASGISIRESGGTQVRGCVVENYMRLNIDDRTGSPLYGNDGGSIVANNIISDFGYGDSAWNWGNANACPIRFTHAPLAQNPAITDVIVQGNIVYDTGRDQVLVDGVPKREPARYKFAVLIETGAPNPPQGLHFFGNILHPGTAGISNVELPP